MSEGSTERVSRRTALLGMTAAGVGAGALAFPSIASAAAAAQYNVQESSYEARGDGTTDDWRAIQEAIDDAGTAGGGIVYFPGGTYVVSRTLTLHADTYLVGAGVDASVVKLGREADTDLLVTDEYAEALGTGLIDVGVEYCGLVDITLEGNSRDNSSGAGFKHYGRGLVIRNATIAYCAGDGLSSERGIGGDQMEAHVSGLVVRDCGGTGIDWRGPHDSTFVNVHVIRCAGQGIRVRGGSGTRAAGYGGAGTMFLNAHVWGGGTKGWNLEQGAYLTQCSGEGASDTQLHVRSNGCSILGGHFFANESNDYGITHGDEGVFPSRTIMITKVGQATVAGARFVNDGGHGNFQLVIELGDEGDAYDGVPHWSSHYNLTVDDGTFNNVPYIWTRSSWFGIARAEELRAITSAGDDDVFTLSTDDDGRLGFHSATPISKPTVTGSRGGNAALASLLTALANYGLITNSTSA